MTRSSVLLVTLLSTLALAQYTPAPAPESPYPTSSSNLEHFPSIIDDLTSSVAAVPYPTGGESSAVPPVYGTGSVSAPPVVTYPTGTAAPTETEAPVPTETGGPVYGVPTATETASVPAPPATTYAPPATVATSYIPVVGGNATASGVETSVASAEPAASGEAISSGNSVAVRLPIVLGAIGLAFAML